MLLYRKRNAGRTEHFVEHSSQLWTGIIPTHDERVEKNINEWRI